MSRQSGEASLYLEVSLVGSVEEVVSERVTPQTPARNLAKRVDSYQLDRLVNQFRELLINSEGFPRKMRLLTGRPDTSVPELVGVQEAAGLAGISKQRVSQLARSGAFPEPVAVLAAGPVWRKADVNRFLARRNPRPGRRPGPGTPRKQKYQPAAVDSAGYSGSRSRDPAPDSLYEPDRDGVEG